MNIAGYDITTKNIKSFIRGNTNKVLSDANLSPLQAFQVSQVELRAVLCGQCLIAGKCNQALPGGIPCQCKTPNMFYDPLKEDSMRRWGRMISTKEEWDLFIAEFEASKYEHLHEYYSLYYQTNYTWQQPLNNNDIVIGEPGAVSDLQEMANAAYSNAYSWDLSMDVTQYDFKQIASDTPVKHTFIIPNTTNTPIKIEKVITSCSCTAPSYSTELADVNQNIQIEIEYSPLNNKGDFYKTSTVVFKAEDNSINISNLVLAVRGKAV